MLPRSDSSLPPLCRGTASPFCHGTTRFIRKHSRVSLVASAVLASTAFGTFGAFGAFGATGAAAAPARSGPWIQVIGALSSWVQAGKVPVAIVAPGTAPSRAGIAEGVAATGATIVQAPTPAAQFSTGRLSTAQPVTFQLSTAQHPTADLAAAKPTAAAGPVKPYLIYDSVTPSAIPGGQRVAVYANGPYATSAAAVSARSHVLWIDTIGSDPQANVLDVEPGDATPYGASQWARARLSAHPNSVAIVYTMRSEWQAVKDNVAALPAWMRARVRYWIADPTGYNHMVPGASATQWYWGQGYDITTASPNFER